MRVKNQSAAPAGSSPAPRLYFVNAWVDFLVIGGFSALLFAAFLPLRGKLALPYLLQTAAFLWWLGNWPHFAATSWRLYHTKENYSQYPGTAFVIPVILIVLVAASLMSPQVIAPYFVKLMLIWSPYHYSGQTVGITLIYARRAGLTVGWMERWALNGFVYGTYFFSTLSAEVGDPKVLHYHGIMYKTLGLPPILTQIALAGMVLSAAALAICLVRRCLIGRKMLPPIILLPALAQFLWFILGPKIPSFRVFVPFFHSTQYLLIAWVMQLKEVMDAKKASPSKSFVFRESGRWFAGNFALGAALFWALPHLFAAPGWPIDITRPVIFAAIQIHHFFVDGVIWKLKNPKVASPLMVNIGQLTGCLPSPAPPTSPALNRR